MQIRSNHADQGQPNSYTRDRGTTGGTATVVGVLFVAFLLFSITLFLGGLPRGPSQLRNTSNIRIMPRVSRRNIRGLSPLTTIRASLQRATRITLRGVTRRTNTLPIRVTGIHKPNFHVGPLASVRPITKNMFITKAGPRGPTRINRGPRVRVNRTLIRQIRHPSTIPRRIRGHFIKFIMLPSRTMRGLYRRRHRNQFTRIRERALRSRSTPRLLRTIRLLPQQFRPLRFSKGRQLRRHRLQATSVTTTRTLRRMATTTTNINRRMSSRQ